MKYAMSDIGIKMLKMQEELSNTYSYKKLSDDIALNCMRHYVLSLPVGFHLENDALRVIENPEINYCENKPGFEIKKEHKIPIVSRDGTLIAYRYDRIVIGHYGAFIEMDDADVYRDNVTCEKGQEWRITNKKYRDTVKYRWYTTKDTSHCKLYFQQRQVSYADYLEKKWYISPFECLDQNELKDLFSLEEDNNEDS